jgi:hypothetical protein
MGVSEVAPRGKPKLCGVSISTSRAELSKAVGSVQPGAHKGAAGNGFRDNVGKDIKGMSRNGIGEVGDDSNAVPGIRGFIGGCVNGWGSMRKSRGRVRT